MHRQQDGKNGLYQSEHEIPFKIETDSDTPSNIYETSFKKNNLPAPPDSSDQLPRLAPIDIIGRAPEAWRLTIDSSTIEHFETDLWQIVDEGQPIKHLNAEAIEDIVLIFDYHLVSIE